MRSFVDRADGQAIGLPFVETHHFDVALLSVLRTNLTPVKAEAGIFVARDLAVDVKVRTHIGGARPHPPLSIHEQFAEVSLAVFSVRDRRRPESSLPLLPPGDGTATAQYRHLARIRGIYNRRVRTAGILRTKHQRFAQLIYAAAHYDG